MGNIIRIRLLTLGLLAAALGSPVLAQNRATFPWWNSPVADSLGLSGVQRTKIHQIVRSYRDRLFDVRNASQKAEAELEDLLNDPDVNVDAAKPVIEKIVTARSNAQRVFLEMSVQLRAVLTLEQWRTLVRHWDEMQRKRPSEVQTPP